MLSVLIIEDHLLARQGLKELLMQRYGAVTVRGVRSAGEGLGWIARGHYDLVIVDMTLPGRDAFQVLDEIRKVRPGTAVLLLGMEPDAREAARAREKGAMGYVSKHSDRPELEKAIDSALNRQPYFAGELAVDPRAAAAATLSARERDVITRIGSGTRPVEIAAELHLNIKTVSTYKRRALAKLGLASEADLVRYLMKNPL
jgi:two-component system, NarL family, invasion response regulator UvrY